MLTPIIFNMIKDNAYLSLWVDERTCHNLKNCKRKQVYAL